jgi:hypothetical protein
MTIADLKTYYQNKLLPAGKSLDDVIGSAIVEIDNLELDRDGLLDILINLRKLNDPKTILQQISTLSDKFLDKNGFLYRRLGIISRLEQAINRLDDQANSITNIINKSIEREADKIIKASKDLASNGQSIESLITSAATKASNQIQNATTQSANAAATTIKQNIDDLVKTFDTYWKQLKCRYPED